MSEEYWVTGGYVCGHGVAHAEGHGDTPHEENRVLRTPATSQAIQAPRRAALTTTKVPRFDGATSWEQYHQVFEVIVRSNGWIIATVLASRGRCAECHSLSTAEIGPDSVRALAPACNFRLRSRRYQT